MFKRSHYIALGLILALALALFLLPAQTTARLKLALGSLFLPLFGLAGSSHQLAEKAGETVTPRRQLIKENQTLRAENQRLQTQALQTDEVIRENNRLRSQLNWRQLQKTWALKSAKVITRDPANWWRTVQIDLGSRDGMKTNFTVLTPAGLVGRIAAVNFSSSQVVLLGDPDCKVAAQVEETRDMGIVGAGGAFDSSLATMSYLPKDANLKPSQTVVTSGLGGVFPQGIPVGKIVDSRQIEYGLYTEARLKLAANLSALEEVWVLLP